MGQITRKGSLSKFENIRRRIRTYKTWYKIIFPFNRIFRGVQHMRLRNGKSAYVRSVRSMDVNIISDVLGGNEYDLEQLRLPPHATIVDLGGNIGTFAMEMHRLFPTADIISYEPYPANCEMFTMNAPYAMLVQKAASGKTGAVQLEDTSNYVGLRVVEKGGIKVEAESLDDILKDFVKVDLLKIDIEGSEYEVLNNASTGTLKKVDRILMETHDVPGFDDLEWAEQILTKHGFTVSWIDKLGIVYGERHATEVRAAPERAR